MEETLNADELAVIADITAKIKETCSKRKYTHLCIRVQTETGMAYVVNRCISMMSKDKIKLSMALATIESELEGVS